MIRYPHVAGSFYPKNKKELQKVINNYLAQAASIAPKLNLRILIVPHAGYIYSGQVAGWGFKQVSKNINQVILLGVSHHYYLKNLALFSKGSFITPLGSVKIAEELANKLIKENPLIKIDPDSHLQEHSLEVELPFLQTVLKNFTIIPLLLGRLKINQLEDLAKSITHNLSRKTLLLISSDLSHYPNCQTANIADKLTINSILSNDLKFFLKTLNQVEQYPGVETACCGQEAIKAGLLVAKNLYLKAKLLKYANSAAAGGDKNQVVGYASIGFYE